MQGCVSSTIAGSSAEAGSQLNVVRPAELSEWPRPVELVATAGEDGGVAGEGGRVAADIGDAPHAGRRKLLHLFLGACSRRVDHDCVEGGKLLYVIRPA